MSRLARLFAFCLLGCSGGYHQPDYRTDPGTPGDFGDGKLLIAWTIGGQPPTQAACAGVDHLVLALDNGYEQVEISPIPCLLTRFRYDGLPSGDATLSLTAYDASGCIAMAGSADGFLSATLPADPSPVLALDTLAACH